MEILAVTALAMVGFGSFALADRLREIPARVARFLGYVFLAPWFIYMVWWGCNGGLP